MKSFSYLFSAAVLLAACAPVEGRDYALSTKTLQPGENYRITARGQAGIAASPLHHVIRQEAREQCDGPYRVRATRINTNYSEAQRSDKAYTIITEVDCLAAS